MIETTRLQEKRMIDTPLGTVSYTENDIVLFPEGIIGFEDKSKFVIFTKIGFEPFQWLICVNDPALQLPIVDPLLVKTDYLAKSGIRELQSIGLDNITDGQLYVIVTVGKSIHDVSANLRGPIVINPTRKLGKQIILSESNYSLKQPILAGSQN